MQHQQSLCFESEGTLHICKDLRSSGRNINSGMRLKTPLRAQDLGLKCIRHLIAVAPKFFPFDLLGHWLQLSFSGKILYIV